MIKFDLGWAGIGPALDNAYIVKKDSSVCKNDQYCIQWHCLEAFSTRLLCIIYGISVYDTEA